MAHLHTYIASKQACLETWAKKRQGTKCGAVGNSFGTYWELGKTHWEHHKNPLGTNHTLKSLEVDVWLGPFIHLFNCAESALAGHKIEHCWEPESSIFSSCIRSIFLGGGSTGGGGQLVSEIQVFFWIIFLGDNFFSKRIGNFLEIFIFSSVNSTIFAIFWNFHQFL